MGTDLIDMRLRLFCSTFIDIHRLATRMVEMAARCGMLPTERLIGARVHWDIYGTRAWFLQSS